MVSGIMQGRLDKLVGSRSQSVYKTAIFSFPYEDKSAVRSIKSSFVGRIQKNPYQKILPLANP